MTRAATASAWPCGVYTKRGLEVITLCPVSSGTVTLLAGARCTIVDPRTEWLVNIEHRFNGAKICVPLVPISELELAA